MFASFVKRKFLLHDTQNFTYFKKNPYDYIQEHNDSVLMSSFFFNLSKINNRRDIPITEEIYLI